MAGKKMIQSKVPASSLLEVVISMVVIVMVLGIALTIFTNVVRSSLSAKQLRAQAILNRSLLNLEFHPDSITQDTIADGWKVEQEVKPFAGGGRLQEVHLILYDENRRQVAEIRKVIIGSHEEHPSN